MFQVVSNRLHILLDGHVKKGMSTNNISWLKRSRAVISVVLVFFIIIGASALLLNPLHWVIAASYSSQVVSRGLLDVSVQAPGWLQSGVYNLTFQGINGNIQEIDVKQGQKVVRGQLLARLDPVSLQQSVFVAQASLDAAKKNLYGVLLHQGDTIASINLRIAAVQKVVNVAQVYVDATKRDTNVNVIVAKATLADDQHTLNDTHKAAVAQMKLAEAQRQHDLLLCPTPTPTLISISPIAIVAGTPTLTVTTNDSAQSDAISDTCVQQANATYKQEVAAAHVSITAFIAQVNKDQQLLEQAYTNSGVNNAGAHSQLVNSQDQAIGDETNTDATAAISQVKTAEGQLEVATAQLGIAQYDLDHADLTAPHSGVVTAINGTVSGPPGIPPDSATGNSSAPSGIFIQIVDLTSVQQIMTNVSETDITSVQIGQPIQFRLKAYNDRQFDGTVSAISPNGVANGNSITYPVITTIDQNNRDGTVMLPNMTATVIINVLHNTDALRIPASAVNKIASLVSKQEGSIATSKALDMLKQMIKVHPNLVNHKPFPTFVVEQSEQDNTFMAKPVVLGLTDGTYYEVLRGVAENEHVLVGK